MHRKLSRQRRSLGFESLEARAMFANLANLEVGGFCEAVLSPVETAVIGSSSALKTNAAAKGPARPSYSYSVIGDSQNANVARLSGGLAIMGGGTDVDAAFRWLGNKAQGGDFVVLTASSSSGYGSYINGLTSVNSVETLGIASTAAASDPFVFDKIANAEAIFITGGDQANYINFWKNTPLEEAIYVALQRGVPLGGTSAGLAVLGDIDFSATSPSGTISSAEALANPMDPRITLDTEFLNVSDSGSAGTVLQLVDNIIMEPHFMQRTRMGRMMSFMANMDVQNLVTGLPRGIAVNEQTALLVEVSGNATVVGNAYARKLTPTEQQRSVYFLSGITDDPTPLLSEALTYRVNVQRANYDPVGRVSDTFSLSSWAGVDGVDSWNVLASNGTLPSNLASIYGSV